MKAGKISESILKRSVLKQLHSKNERVTAGAGVGQDYSAVSLGKDEQLVMATNSITWEMGDNRTYAQLAIHTAINNVVTAGASPLGVLVDVLLPTLANEAQLRELMKEMDTVCGELGIQILGGHTQVTRGVKAIVTTVTGVGVEMDAEGLCSNKQVQPGMDLIVTKWIGLSGTALLAQEKESELRQRYAQPFLDKAKAYIGDTSVVEEALIAAKAGACGMHDLSEGGIFAALWEMAQAAGVGLDIDLKKIPIRQETVEICEFFDVNPYKLLSTGSMLIAARDGSQVIRELEKAGIAARVVGVTTDSNDRVLIQGEERRFLETAQTDELYKLL